MQYGLTSSILTRLKIKNPPAGTESDFRFCWEVNYASICGKKLLIVIHADTRYGMVFCDIKPGVWKDFPAFMRGAIREALLREGFDDSEVEKYFAMASEVSCTKTHGRKAMGGMNHIVTNLPYIDKELVPGMFQPCITNSINRDICTTAVHPEWDYFYPNKAFVQEMSKLLRDEYL